MGKKRGKHSLQRNQYIKPGPYRPTAAVLPSALELTSIGLGVTNMKGMTSAKQTLTKVSAADPEDDDLPQWKRYARLVLPHVGMVIISSLYTIAGATVFYVVESPYEQQVRATHLRTINDTRLALLDDLWTLMQQNPSEEDWNRLANEKLDNLTEVLFHAFEERYVTIKDIQRGYGVDNQWTYAAAIFFAATTITTIGYGNLVPVTKEGRIICVVFGLFGVPLMLVTIADIGKFISDILILVYTKCQTLKKRLFVNGKKTKRNLMREDMQQDLLDLTGPDDSRVHIPVTLILLIVLGYTSLGGVLLRSWEVEWSFFDSFYFCFITMTTIGFGDFAPQNESYYALTLLYILLGLAITTMCVDLAGSEYIEKIHNFGRKIRNAREMLKTMGDVMRYAAFLKKKYGLTDEQLISLPIPNRLQLDSFLPSAYMPEDFHKWRFIDQRTESLRDSLLTSTRGSLSDAGACNNEDSTNSFLLPQSSA